MDPYQQISFWFACFIASDVVDFVQLGKGNRGSLVMPK
jgi:hypothetical protein